MMGHKISLESFKNKCYCVGKGSVYRTPEHIEETIKISNAKDRSAD